MKWVKINYGLALAGKDKGYTGISSERYTMSAKEPPKELAQQMVSFCVTLLEFAIATGIITQEQAIEQATKAGEVLKKIKFNQ